MMKLYYSTGTSSTTSHIAMEESGLKYTGIEVSWQRNVNVEELEGLNPLGTVPTLVSEQGKVLTQNIAILEYIADLAPSSHLLPPAGSWERADTMRWVSFAGSDLQKAFNPLFAAESMATSESARTEIAKFATERVHVYLKHLDQNLSGKEFIVDKKYTIADIYLFSITNWCKWFDVSTSEYKNLSSYLSRIYQRPAVQKILKMEDLLD